MATPRMDITSFVGKLLEQDDVDLLREGVRVLAQAVMETEVSSQIGAAPYERSSSRAAYRNGYRTRTWDTRVGTIELNIRPRVVVWSTRRPVVRLVRLEHVLSLAGNIRQRRGPSPAVDLRRGRDGELETSRAGRLRTFRSSQ